MISTQVQVAHVEMCESHSISEEPRARASLVPLAVGLGHERDGEVEHFLELQQNVPAGAGNEALFVVNLKRHEEFSHY